MRDCPRVRVPGERYEHSSAATQILVLIAEAITGDVWADVFRDSVWSKMRATAPLQVHLSGQGRALAHGGVSGQLRDLACLGALYTPSWEKVATQQIVSDAALSRIHACPRPSEFFHHSAGGEALIDQLGNDEMLGSSRHWDCVWADGDMFKGEVLGQGLYVSPGRDLVIAYVATTQNMQFSRYLRPLATFGNHIKTTRN